MFVVSSTWAVDNADKDALDGAASFVQCGTSIPTLLKWNPFTKCSVVRKKRLLTWSRCVTSIKISSPLSVTCSLDTSCGAWVENTTIGMASGRPSPSSDIYSLSASFSVWRRTRRACIDSLFSSRIICSNALFCRSLLCVKCVMVFLVVFSSGVERFDRKLIIFALASMSSSVSFSRYCAILPLICCWYSCDTAVLPIRSHMIRGFGRPCARHGSFTDPPSITSMSDGASANDGDATERNVRDLAMAPNRSISEYTYHRWVFLQPPSRCRLHCDLCTCIVPGPRAACLPIAVCCRAECEIVHRANFHFHDATSPLALDHRLTASKKTHQFDRPWKKTQNQLTSHGKSMSSPSITSVSCGPRITVGGASTLSIAGGADLLPAILCAEHSYLPASVACTSDMSKLPESTVVNLKKTTHTLASCYSTKWLGAKRVDSWLQCCDVLTGCNHLFTIVKRHHTHSPTTNHEYPKENLSIWAKKAYEGRHISVKKHSIWKISTEKTRDSVHLSGKHTQSRWIAQKPAVCSKCVQFVTTFARKKLSLLLSRAFINFASIAWNIGVR